MTLIDVYADMEHSQRVLFELLRERKPHESISHKAMPGWCEHCHFVANMPYLAWYLIQDGSFTVGACYLTRQRELGIGIFQAQRGKGYGTLALQQLMQAHPGRFLANIAPGNEKSLALFRRLGFAGPIQVTLEKS
jgi:RimJ/RimL family protein N-acetyltransferase